VPRDWTDRAHPDAYRDANIAPCLLRLERLSEVVEILNELDTKIEVDQ
jgi:hypothetical protein